MRSWIPSTVRLLVDSLRASFWFVPGAMLAGSFVLAIGISRLDHAGVEIPWLRWFESTAGARAILTTVASSMITVTGVVFSITIVALTLATSQFGPRLLRGFMRDRANQLVLGTFVSTFLYCLVMLVLLPPGADVSGVPQISVSVAVLLAFASLLVLVFFIHHVSTSIQAESVIGAVVGEMDGQLRRLRTRATARPPDGERPAAPPDVADVCSSVSARSSGYLNAVASARIAEWACRREVIVSLVPMPGDFVVEGDTLLHIHDPAERRSEVRDQDRDELLAAVSLGRRRTPECDLRFLFQQIVEIALRALSPGINDPITATACVHRLTSALCAIVPLPTPSGVHSDGQGDPRLWIPEPTFEDYLSSSVDPVREAGGAHTSVLLALTDLLASIADRTRDPERRALLSTHLDALVVAAERELNHPRDRQRVKRRAESLRSRLARVAPAPLA